MTEDTADANELKLKEISPERLVMESEDAIHSFEFRLNDQKAKKEEYSSGVPVPPIININIKNYESAIRLVDRVLEKQPDATLSDVASELSRQLQQQNLPTETMKKLESALKEVNSLLIDFRGDIRRLTPEERKYVLTKRKPKETSETSEQKVIQEALQKGIFRANFSAVLISEKGEREWAGWKEFFSQGMTKEDWDGKYQQDPLLVIIPECHDNHGRPDNEITQFLSEENVIDAVAVRPEYTRKVKTSTTRTTQTTTGLMGRQKDTAVEIKQTEFDKNEPVLFRGTDEPAVRICYRTLTYGTFYEGAQKYTDENGRPGNHLSIEIVVPLSVAKKISQEGKKDPGFYRKLAQGAVLDKQLGVIGVDRRIKLYDNHADRKDDPRLKNHDSLPPYEDEDWKNSKMLVSVNLEIPQDDRSVITPDLPTYGLNKIELAKQKLQKIIVSPKK